MSKNFFSFSHKLWFYEFVSWFPIIVTVLVIIALFVFFIFSNKPDEGVEQKGLTPTSHSQYWTTIGSLTGGPNFQWRYTLKTGIIEHWCMPSS